ncbi:MAG: TrkA family potassium uptake protein [Ruminococcaceae bacterium]|nr:TrkA family potassium uptake protein [Oscillospiraceae bacterium]
MNTTLVIGAGRFGKHLALNLCKMGNEVMLVDRNETVIDELSHRVTAAEIGDYTLYSNLEALGVEDYDYIFVCIGKFQESLVIVDHLKRLGAQKVIAKASSSVHERFLNMAGADAIIYPERDTAYSTAVEYSNRNIYDFIKLSDDEGIYEIEVPSSWCGKSLLKLNVRKLLGLSVIASKDENGNVKAIKDPEYVFSKDEHIIVMGNKNDIRKLTKN